MRSLISLFLLAFAVACSDTTAPTMDDPTAGVCKAVAEYPMLKEGKVVAILMVTHVYWPGTENKIMCADSAAFRDFIMSVPGTDKPARIVFTPVKEN